VGSHTITAVYGGDSSFAGSTSNVVTQQVDANTTTTLTSAPNPSNFGQTVQFTAQVSVQSPGTGYPNAGSVTFYNGSSSIGTVSLTSTSGGKATISYSSLPVGFNSIRAVYNASGAYEGSTSNTVKQTVNRGNKVNTTTAVSSTTATSVFGQSVTFTARITPNTATGSVTFKDGTTTLQTVSLSGGSAALSVGTLAVGSHSITAVYGGDTNDNGSTSSPVSLTVGKANTKTALSDSRTSVTATITAVTPGSGTPSGSVTFFDVTANKTLGTVTLSGGQATIAPSGRISGHTIKATYSGDGNFSPSSDTIRF